MIYIHTAALHNIHTSFRVFLNLKVFLLWALCLWSLDLSDISELPSPPPPETCLAFSPLVTEMKHATLFGSWVWFYKKMWTFSTKWLFFGLLELLCISENKGGKISSLAILIFDIKCWWKIILLPFFSNLTCPFSEKGVSFLIACNFGARCKKCNIKLYMCIALICKHVILKPRYSGNSFLLFFIFYFYFS